MHLAPAIPVLFLAIAVSACAPKVARGPVAATREAPIVLEAGLAGPTTLLAVVAAGSRFDPPGREGLAFYTASLLARRAPGLTVTVDRDSARFRLACGAEPRETCTRAFLEALTTPVTTPGGSMVVHAQPALPDLLYRIAGAGTPDAWPAAGRPGTSGTFTVSEASHFQATRYRRGALAFGTTSTDDDQLLLHASRALPLQQTLSPAHFPPAATPCTIHHVHGAALEGEQALVALRADLDDPLDRVALHLAAQALFGFSVPYPVQLDSPLLPWIAPVGPPQELRLELETPGRHLEGFDLAAAVSEWRSALAEVAPADAYEERLVAAVHRRQDPTSAIPILLDTVTLADLERVAAQVVRPEHLVLMVAGPHAIEGSSATDVPTGDTFCPRVTVQYHDAQEMLR